MLSFPFPASVSVPLCFSRVPANWEKTRTSKSERPSCPRNLYLCSNIPFRATNPLENRAANPINSCHSQTKTGGSRGGAEREGTVRGGRGRCEVSGPAAGAGWGGRRLGVSPTSTPPPTFVRALPCLPVRHDSIQAPLTWEDSTTLLPWVLAHLARCLAPEMDA